jgi:hypothetical protein
VKDPRDHDDLGPLFDPPFARGSDTSEAAAESMKGLTGEQRARVYAYVLGQGPAGATSDEAQVALGMLAQSCTARIYELVNNGMLLDTGRRRRTRTGRMARVLIAKPLAVQA